MRGTLPRGSTRSVDRGAYRRGIERRKQCNPGCRCCRGKQKATGAGSTSQGPSPPRVVFRPSACTYTSCAGTGISLSPPWEAAPGPHRRPEAVADDERGKEVRLADSTGEAGEQSGTSRGGAGGGKQWDQEECETAKHGPNAEPGSRVTGAGSHTWSRHQGQEGEAHSRPAPHHGRRPAAGLLQSEEGRCSRCRWRDLGGL